MIKPPRQRSSDLRGGLVSKKVFVTLAEWRHGTLLGWGPAVIGQSLVANGVAVPRLHIFVPLEPVTFQPISMVGGYWKLTQHTSNAARWGSITHLATESRAYFWLTHDNAVLVQSDCFSLWSVGPSTDIYRFPPAIVELQLIFWSFEFHLRDLMRVRQHSAVHKRLIDHL